jgi:hypothetical protein
MPAQTHVCCHVKCPLLCDLKPEQERVDSFVIFAFAKMSGNYSDLLELQLCAERHAEGNNHIFETASCAHRVYSVVYLSH